jgi:hypothetical protein
MRRTLSAAILGLALAAWPAAAEDSAAVQLQKGIFAQQTTGDLDAAIQIFRQIIASNPVERVYAAQAQMHLAQALLQKGDLNGAAMEFTTLASNYSEFRDLISGMARRLAGAQPNRVFSRGTVTVSKDQPDRFAHSTGVSLTAPQGWRMASSGPSSDGGDMVMFSTSNFKADELAVWMRSADGEGNDISGSLRGYLENKKKTNMQSWPDWTVRPESVQNRVVSGQQALSAVADYTENGKKMVEYLIWVRSVKNHVVFLGYADAEDLAALQSGMDQLAATAVIP